MKLIETSAKVELPLFKYGRCQELTPPETMKTLRLIKNFHFLFEKNHVHFPFVKTRFNESMLH